MGKQKPCRLGAEGAAGLLLGAPWKRTNIKRQACRFVPRRRNHGWPSRVFAGASHRFSLRVMSWNSSSANPAETSSISRIGESNAVGDRAGRAHDRPVRGRLLGMLHDSSKVLERRLNVRLDLIRTKREHAPLSGNG